MVNTTRAATTLPAGTEDEQAETYESFPVLRARVLSFYAAALQAAAAAPGPELVKQR